MPAWILDAYADFSLQSIRVRKNNLLLEMISTVKDPLAPATGEFLLPLMYLERGQRRPVMYSQLTVLMCLCRVP